MVSLQVYLIFIYYSSCIIENYLSIYLLLINVCRHALVFIGQYIIAKTCVLMCACGVVIYNNYKQQFNGC